MRFLGHVLSKCLKVVPEYKVAFVTLSYKDTSRFYLKQGETDGIVNYGLSMKNIIVSALLTSPDEFFFWYICYSCCIIFSTWNI